MLNRTQLEIHASFVHLHLLLIADSKPSSNGLYTSHIKHVNGVIALDRIFPVSYGREYVIGGGSEDVNTPYLFFSPPLPEERRWLRR